MFLFNLLLLSNIKYELDGIFIRIIVAQTTSLNVLYKLSIKSILSMDDATFHPYQEHPILVIYSIC